MGCSPQGRKSQFCAARLYEGLSYWGCHCEGSTVKECKRAEQAGLLAQRSGQDGKTRGGVCVLNVERASLENLQKVEWVLYGASKNLFSITQYAEERMVY